MRLVLLLSFANAARCMKIVLSKLKARELFSDTSNVPFIRHRQTHHGMGRWDDFISFSITFRFVRRSPSAPVRA
jgi:hypothetical protein